MIEHDAIALAKLTPSCGWHALQDPETVKLDFNKAELEARIRRAHRQLVEGGLPPKQYVDGDDGKLRGETEEEFAERLLVTNATSVRIPGETHQQWVDRIGIMSGRALELLHTMRVAYINLEALS